MGEEFWEERGQMPPFFPSSSGRTGEGAGCPQGTPERLIPAIPVVSLPPVRGLCLVPCSTCVFLTSSSCRQREPDGDGAVLTPRVSFLSCGQSDRPAGAGSLCPRAHPSNSVSLRMLPWGPENLTPREDLLFPRVQPSRMCGGDREVARTRTSAVTVIESEKPGALGERTKQAPVPSASGDDLSRGTGAVQRTRGWNVPSGSKCESPWLASVQRAPSPGLPLFTLGHHGHCSGLMTHLVSLSQPRRGGASLSWHLHPPCCGRSLAGHVLGQYVRDVCGRQSPSRRTGLSHSCQSRFQNSVWKVRGAPGLKEHGSLAL